MDLADVLTLGVCGWNRSQTTNIDRFYSMCPEEVADFLGGRLLNFGYWAAGAATQQVAARALVHQVAQLANLQSAETLLDVGCGFGEAALILHRKYQVEQVVGVNVTGCQLEFARARARALRVQGNVRFCFGDATQLPFDDSTFDHVVALESAFHFDSREAFMEEAARVLKPGGRVTLADVVPLKSKKGLLRKYAASRLWLFPITNAYGAEQYVYKLGKAGFESIELRSIGAAVYPGYVDWTLSSENRERLRQQLGRTKATLYRWQTQLLKALFERGHLDYVMVSASKPNS